MASLGSNGLGMGIVFTLQDHFTGVAKKIQAEQAKLKSSTEGLAEGMSKITSAKLLAGGVAVLAPLGGMVRMAAELSDQLANVQKTTGLTDTELGKLRSTVEGFDTRTSIADLLEIGTVGGRLGVAKDELNGFIETVDKAVVALGDDFSGGAEQIATELGKIKTLFGDTKNLKFDVALNQIGSALNELGNSGANSAPSVANFTRRIGQLGNLAPTLSQTLGLGATLEELGLRADIAAGGVTNILTVAGQNQAVFAKQMGISIDKFRELINTSPNDMLIELSKSFAGMDNSSTISALKEMKLGSQESIKVILGLSNATELLTKRQELAAKAMTEGLSLQAEFDIKNRTLQAQIDKLTKKFIILGQRIGTVVAPMFTGLAVVVGGLVDLFTFIVKSPIGKFMLQLTTIVAMGAVAWGAYTLVVKPAISALANFAKQAVITLMAMAPYILMALPFIALIEVIRRSRKAFADFNGVVGTGFTLFLQRVGGVVEGILAIASSWDNVTETFLLSKGLAQKLQQLGILDFVVALGTWLVRIIEFFRGMLSGVKAVFGFIGKIGASIMKLFKPILGVLSSIAKMVGVNTTEVKLWMEAGKLAGIVIGIALAAIAANFVIMGITAVISMLPMIALLALIGLAIWAVIKIGQWLIEKFQEIWGESTGWLDFGKNMVKNIWEGVKSLWGSFTTWLSQALKDIPLVGRLFQDEESTATVNQQINPATNPIGDSMAIQQGLLSSPIQQFQPGSGVMQNQPIQANLILDGRTIATAVGDKNKIEQARE